MVGRAPFWVYVSVAFFGVFAPGVFAFVVERAPEGLDPLVILDKYGLQGLIATLLIMAYPHKAREMKENASLAKETREYLHREKIERQAMAEEWRRLFEDLRAEIIENRNTIRDHRD